MVTIYTYEHAQFNVRIKIDLQLVFAAVLLTTVVNAARLDNTYLPPQNSRNSGGSGHFLTPPFQQQHGKPSFQASGSGFPKFAGSASFGGASSTFNRQGGSYNRQAAHIPILRFDNKNNGDGSYQFKWVVILIVIIAICWFINDTCIYKGGNFAKHKSPISINRHSSANFASFINSNVHMIHEWWIYYV